MSRHRSEAALLLADITGSTLLYQDVGDVAALRQIGECLAGLRAMAGQEGGIPVRTKGDDVLCVFAGVSSALRAVRRMLAQQLTGRLAVHAGVHYGHVIHADGDIFGDAVNLTARLASLANPGEVLMSQSFVDRLPEADTQTLRILDSITFKGRSAPTQVWSLCEDDPSLRTEIPIGHDRGHPGLLHQAASEVTVTLRYGDHAQLCRESASLSIGRSAECDLVIGRPWVSRRHATIAVLRGKVQLGDRSSLGTYVLTRDGHEFFMRRETVLLTGSGTICPAMRPTDAGAEAIHYEVVSHPDRGR